MVTDHVYYLASEDRVYGNASEELARALRRAWSAHRVDSEMTRFDGASTWLVEERREVRVCRKQLDSPVFGGSVDVLAVPLEMR
jgi:hypothetical protein